MTKNEKGISMIVLVISIVVIMIIAGIGINIGFRMVNNTHEENIKTNMLLIKAKAKLCEEEVAFKTANKNNQTEIEQIQSQEYIGTKLANVENQPVDEKIDFLISNNILPNPIEEEQEFLTYYYLSQENLNSMGLSEIKEKEGEYYFVKYDEEKIEVVFTKGYTDLDGNVYYTLSQLNEL